LALLAALTALAVWWLPDWARQQAQAQAQQVLGTPVTIDKIVLQPWSLAAQVQGLRVGPAEAPIFKLDSVQASLAPESLWRLTPVVERLTLQGPQLWVQRNAQGLYNFAPLLTHVQDWQARQPPTPPSGEPARFALHNLRLADGQVHYRDDLLGQRHEIRALQVGLPFISNLPSDVLIDVQPRLEAQVDGSQLKLGGQARPFAPGVPAQLKLQWQQLALQDWAGLLKTVLPPDLPVDLRQGQLDADVAISFESPQGKTPQLRVRGELNVRSLQLGLPAQGTELAWRTLTLRGLDLAPLEQHYDLAEVALQGLDAHYTLGQASPPRTSAAPRRQPAAAAASTPDASASSPDRNGAHAQSAPALQWKIQRLSCEDCRVQVHDRHTSPATDISLQQARLSLAPLSSDFSQPMLVELAAAVASSAGGKPANPPAGQASIKGELTLQPLSLEALLDLAAIDLRVAQPYLAPYVNLTLSGGQLGTQGRLKLAQAPATGADAGLNLGYQGQLSLSGLSTQDSVNGADLLSWKTLGLQGLNLSLRNNSAVDADLGQISLDGLQARLILHPDGHLNVADIARHSPQSAPQSLTTPQTAANSANGKPAERPAAASSASTSTASAGDNTSARATKGTAAKPSSPGPNLRWQGVKLSRSEVYFSDYFIKPNYSARLTKLQGSLSALSSQAPQPAKLDVSGALDDGAPLRITGTLHPLGARLYTNIEASARGIALPRLSTYAERYAGYGIDKGSLSVTVHYKIEQGKLEADNQLYLDQLTFGERVDSPDALNLPVLLAVSLLKDRNGVIDLRLPVSGTLDDPQFSIGGILWKMVLNIIGKAATAPFALLMGGDSEELGQIDFAPGSTELDAAARTRLDTLAAKLADRPQLKLEATGWADPVADGAQLQQAAAAAAASAAAGKPRARASAAAPAASAPAAAPSPEALQALADSRAAKVMAYLAERLPAERVLLNRSVVAAPGGDGQAGAPKVQFTLK